MTYPPKEQSYEQLSTEEKYPLQFLSGKLLKYKVTGIRIPEIHQELEYVWIGFSGWPKYRGMNFQREYGRSYDCAKVNCPWRNTLASYVDHLKKHQASTLWALKDNLASQTSGDIGVK